MELLSPSSMFMWIVLPKKYKLLRMDNHHNVVREDDSYNHGRKIIMHSLYHPKLSPSLDLKVFYVRISNCEIDEWTPEHLTLNHILLTPDTVLEVNGSSSSIYSECVSFVLRWDRVGKRSEEATFVSTDSISVTGSVRFEVYARGDMLLSRVQESSKVNGGSTGNDNGVVREDKVKIKRWRMKCQPVLSGGSSCFLKGGHCPGPDVVLPMVELYVAGCFSGTPIILTKTLQIGVQKKLQTKVMLEAIPEDETTEQKTEVLSKDTLQLSEYHDFSPEHNVDVNCKSIYSRAEYFEGEDGELSWFNAGASVGVGLGLGIFLRIGVGVGLLVRTYQSTTKNFKRQLI